MVKRRGLADMLRTETQKLEQSPEPPDSVSSIQTDIQSPVEQVQQPVGRTDQLGLSDTPIEAQRLPLATDSVLTDSVIDRETESVELPKYQRLVRKEARLHEAQYDHLTRLARELNRKKRGTGEIITANTLLRVATELLLRRRSDLRGDTEDELLSSLTERG